MKRRALCLWLVDWAIQRRLARFGEPSAKKTPLLILFSTTGGRGSRVVARCSAARRLGVTPGMPTAEAQALVSRSDTVLLEADDPIGDRDSLDRLATWCQRFSPLISIEASDRAESLFLDITGCAHLWGSEAGLARDILSELSRYRLRARVGVADTFGAAWAVAHHTTIATGRHDNLTPEIFIVPSGETSRALLPLSVAALRLPVSTIDTLHQLGITRIGQLEALSRASLMSRFPAELLTRLDQAMGRAGEILTPKDPPVELEDGWRLEYPIAQTDAVVEIAEQLLRSLLEQLRLGHGVTAMEIVLIGENEAEAAAPRRFPVGLCRPSANARHIVELVRLALERIELDQPVIEVRVQIKGTAPREILQRELFDASMDRPEREVDCLIDRLSGRLGKNRVLAPRLVADAQPERSIRPEPVVDVRSSRLRHSPRSIRSPRRPLRLLSRPRRIEVDAAEPGGLPSFIGQSGGEERITLAWGPERIETGWWRGRPIGRDYYRVELSSGRRLWIFRDIANSDWFLHGAFE